MHRDTRERSPQLRTERWLRPALTASALVLACSGTEQGREAAPRERNLALGTSNERPKEAEVLPLEALPFIDGEARVETFLQRLREPTPLGENVAVHVRLPPPTNERLAKSLVRVLGDPESPLVLFSTDALARLGHIEQSPGPEFFTAFLRLDERELERRARFERVIAASADEPSRTTLVFEGRTPVAITTGVSLDLSRFLEGGLIPLGPCPIMPASVLARWEESLLITDPVVVQDTTRTHDFCAPGGDPNGVWTFKHLMEEMAIGSGLSTHDFVVSWLSQWLVPQVINSDPVPARTQMFDQVIRPWANQSGVLATLSATGVLGLSGPLNLDIAPFRLSAIVNRIDLGDTVDGPSGYGGTTTSEPVDAGELRFVFGVQDLDSCNVLRFSVIFEYGVPITGCTGVRDWAVEWTRLNDPAFAPRFSPAWLAHLEGLTESVVKNGAAPAKGNQNALNQIRTNEIALDGPWELREFTLTSEDPVLDTDTPTNGPLQPHTVAMTPDDGVFSPTPHPVVDTFVLNDVLSTVPAAVPVLPDDCSSAFTVPGQYVSGPFRGGNALTAPPTHWNASVNPGDNRELCARHELSVNTCNGCHFADTSTPFLHVDPAPMPAALSGFLTGGGGIWSVPDTQFGAPSWTFADLDRRFRRLYELACATCGSRFGTFPDFVDLVAELNQLVPIDPVDPEVRFPFQSGPIEDIDVLARLFEARLRGVNPRVVEDVELDGVVRPVQTFVH